MVIGYCWQPLDGASVIFLSKGLTAANSCTEEV